MRLRPSPRRWSEAALRTAGGYVVLAVLATGLAVALRDGAPWTHPRPWLVAPLPTALAASTMLGLTVALAAIAFTRVTVRRYSWARRLHEDLRPVARDFTLGQILVIAGLSSLGEELLFRGVLVPALGVVAPAILFGLVHQLRGPSRWVWSAWAMVVGLLLGAVFALTGSLVGPLLAHAVINAANLTFLRDHDAAY